MSNIKRWGLLLIVSVLILSCIKPTEKTVEEDLIEQIERQLEELNRLKGDDEELKRLFENIMENYDVMFVFHKGSSIMIDSREAKPGPETIAYTMGDNRFRINRDLYVTVVKKKVALSLDGRSWFSMENDSRKDLEGLYNDYHFETEVKDDNIEVGYSMAFTKGRKPLEVELPEARKIVRLKRGMIFGSKEESEITDNLNEKILLVPAGTTIYGTFHVRGNLLKSSTDSNGKITISSLRDFYIYFRRSMLSLSFDRENWGVSIFSFKVDPVFNIYAEEDDKVIFDISADANYDSEEKSLSIVKLLLNMM